MDYRVFGTSRLDAVKIARLKEEDTMQPLLSLVRSLLAPPLLTGEHVELKCGVSKDTEKCDVSTERPPCVSMVTWIVSLHVGSAKPRR